jgi:electron transport complex protein RnfG
MTSASAAGTAPAKPKGPIPSTLPNMILSLTIICSISALLLGGAYLLTKPQIESRTSEKQVSAVRAVLPPFDNQPLAEATWLGKSGQVLERTDADAPLALTKVFPATMQGTSVGWAVMSYSDRGYAKRIVTMTGFLPDGRINSIQVMEQGETPGLGTKITEARFLDQFSGKNPATSRIVVRKDGGDIDAITAATISSRALCDAVTRSYAALEGTLQPPRSEGGQK